jgi:hypothetical protein
VPIEENGLLGANDSYLTSESIRRSFLERKGDGKDNRIERLVRLGKFHR